MQGRREEWKLAARGNAKCLRDHSVIFPVAEGLVRGELSFGDEDEMSGDAFICTPKVRRGRRE